MNKGADESTRLAEYIHNAPTGAIVAAFTSNSAEALHNATDTLKSELGVDLDIFMEATGGNNLRGYRGSFAFIAQKGYASKAIVVKEPDTNKSHIHPANITAALLPGMLLLPYVQTVGYRLGMYRISGSGWPDIRPFFLTRFLLWFQPKCTRYSISQPDSARSFLAVSSPNE